MMNLGWCVIVFSVCLDVVFFICIGLGGKWIVVIIVIDVSVIVVSVR